MLLLWQRCLCLKIKGIGTEIYTMILTYFEWIFPLFANHSHPAYFSSSSLPGVTTNLNPSFVSSNITSKLIMYKLSLGIVTASKILCSSFSIGTQKCSQKWSVWKEAWLSSYHLASQKIFLTPTCWVIIKPATMRQSLQTTIPPYEH